MNPVILTIIGAVAGAGLGFVMHKLLGRGPGACPFYSGPYLPMIVLAVVGTIIASIIFTS